MKSPHICNLPNIRKVKAELSGILDGAALAAIEVEIATNAASLFKLGRHHYLFAERQSSHSWRQKVSRYYYAAYHGARAVRLFVKGEYSSDVKDHQRFDKLPDDFPGKARYGNQLPILREDRNICDYDHTARVADLVLGPMNSAKLVTEFLKDVRSYLRKRGVSL